MKWEIENISEFVCLQDLLSALEQAKVRVDLDFCNMLIRKRCLRGDYASAKVSIVLVFISYTGLT